MLFLGLVSFCCGTSFSWLNACLLLRKNSCILISTKYHQEEEKHNIYYSMCISIAISQVADECTIRTNSPKFPVEGVEQGCGQCSTKTDPPGRIAVWYLKHNNNCYLSLSRTRQTQAARQNLPCSEGWTSWG